MGLRDKFLTKLGELKQKTQNMSQVITTSLHEMKEENPLEDAEINKYFEVLCGMGFSAPMGKEAAQKIEHTKKYIEYFLGGVCNEEKLQKAIEAYERSLEFGSSKIEKELTDARFSFEKTGNYRLEKFQANRLVCQKEIDAAKEGYNKILEVIKENVNYKHFSQGLFKLGFSDTIKKIVIADSFCNGDPITKDLITEYVMKAFVSKINDDHYNRIHGYAYDIALMVIKALHFEYYGAEKENYPPINDDEYRVFVNSVGFYKRAIDNHPFDKEKYTEAYAEKIKKAKVLGLSSSYISLDGFCLDDAEDYFCDAVCHMMWKKITTEENWNNNGKDISASQEYEDIFNILRTYFKDLSEG